MTIAISLKVNDGLVLAADSASTLFAKASDGTQGIANVYNNANKIFNLRKGLPLGAITWGSGGIGASSVSTLVKDLRHRFTDDPDHAEWHLDRHNYSVKDVALRLRDFIFDELYARDFSAWDPKPPLGFVVAGYSSGAQLAEEYLVQTLDGSRPEPMSLRELNESGISWNGETEAISRLLQGVSPGLPVLLRDRLNVPPADVARVMKVLSDGLQVPMVVPPMPIQDAINLAGFLVETTIGFSRFSPGPPTVGGPIEVAVITKHEGFKWVQRKHYFSVELNRPQPEPEGEA